MHTYILLGSICVQQSCLFQEQRHTVVQPIYLTIKSRLAINTRTRCHFSIYFSLNCKSFFTKKEKLLIGQQCVQMSIILPSKPLMCCQRPLIFCFAVTRKPSVHDEKQALSVIDYHLPDTLIPLNAVLKPHFVCVSGT